MAKVGSKIKCKHCGKEFTVRFTTEKYCCRACYKEACAIKIAQSNYEAREKRAKKAVVLDKVCVICGTPFLTKRKNVVCCSGKCAYEHNKNKARDKCREEHNVFKERQCVVCGTVFTKTHGLQVCCSPECAKEYQKDQVRSYSKKVEAEKKKKKKPVKPLSVVLQEMKAAGYEPHEYGKYMADQYLKSH